MHYPLPSHAVSVWLGQTPAGDECLFIALPPNPGAAHGSTITLPLTTPGFITLADLLRHRSRAERPTIGTPGVPLQSMVEALLRSDAEAKRYNSSGKKEFTEDVMDDLSSFTFD